MMPQIRAYPNQPVGSHVSWGDAHAEGSVRVFIISAWQIINDSSSAIEFDFRIRLNWSKSFGDDTWFEYAPQDGIRTDHIYQQTGTPVVTTHGASRLSLKTTQMVQGGESRLYPLGITVPGPAQSPALVQFWAKETFYDFNLLVAPHQIKSGVITKIGEHEFKKFTRLYI